MNPYNNTSQYIPKIGVFLFVFAIFNTFKLSFLLDFNEYIISAILSLGLFLLYSCRPNLFQGNIVNSKTILLFIIGALLGTRGNFNSYIGILLLIIPLVFVIFLKPCYKKTILYYFDKFFSITISVSLAAWTLYLVGIPLPHYSFDWNFYSFENYYFFLKIQDAISFYAFPRFQFVFIEPGYFGCLCVILIYIRQYNFRQWQTILYVVALVLSYSLAGYLLFFFGMIPFMLKRGTSKMKYVGIFSIFALLFVYLVFQTGDNVFSSMFEYRLQFEGGSMSHYNRTSDVFENWWRSFFLHEGDFLWGNNDIIKNKFGDVLVGVDLRVYIARFGVLPLIFYFGSMFVYYKAYKSIFSFFYLLLFVIFYYRGYTVMFYMGFPMLYVLGTSGLKERKE